MSSRPPIPLPIVLFTLAYLAIGLLATIITQNWEFTFYIMVVLLLGLSTMAIQSQVTLPTPLLWGLSIWGLMHLIGGIVPVPAGWPINGDERVVYSLWLIPNAFKYDNLVHFYGFGMAMLVCWHALKKTVTLPESSIGLLLLCALAGMGMGALNEIVEFIATVLVPVTNVGGYANTLWDLIWNLMGCIAAGIYVRFTEGKPTIKQTLV